MSPGGRPIDGSTIAEQLASFAVTSLHRGTPTVVRQSVRQRILDIVGIQAAALHLDTSAAALGFVREQGGPGEAHVISNEAMAPVAWAAFANGVLAHSLDYDDTHLPSVLHPSASIVPAAAAMAERAGATAEQLLDAVGIGIETVVRLGMAGYDHSARNSTYFEHGQHATSICGTVGAAVASAALLGLPEAGVVDAIGISTSMAAGVIESNRTGGTVKRIHCGWAAHAGVTAALLAQRGITGPPTAVEGRFGFLQAFLHGIADPAAVTNGLGETWAVPGIFFKPYPANHFTHTALDAARRLRQRGLGADSVESAVLGVATPTVRTIGQPEALKQRPGTGYQAQFSGPYVTAVGFLGGGGLGADLDDFTDEQAQDPTRRALMARIRVEGHARCDEIFPYQFPAVLRVRTHDGRELEEQVLFNRGGPEDPLSDDELTTKFRSNARRSFPSELVEQSLEAIAGLDSGGASPSVLSAFGRSPSSG